MPGGRGNIRHEDGNHFSSENQPKNRRKSKKLLTDLLTKELKEKKEIEIEGVGPDGKNIKVKVPMPSKEIIVQALLRQAARGNIYAIKEVFDRVEGKVTSQVELTGTDGEPIQTENRNYNSVPLTVEDIKQIGKALQDEC